MSYMNNRKRSHSIFSDDKIKITLNLKFYRASDTPKWSILFIKVKKRQNGHFEVTQNPNDANKIDHLRFIHEIILRNGFYLKNLTQAVWKMITGPF